MNHKDKHCRNCRFFDEGHCRRHPPAVAQVGEPGRARWVQRLPVVSEDDYCGEFQPKAPQSRTKSMINSLPSYGSHKAFVTSPGNF